MSNAIIFDLKYTPYRLKRNASDIEREVHKEQRGFYDLTGESNILKYITTEGKRYGKCTALEYLQKSTGVFNDKGMITKKELEEMTARAKANKGNLWHGFISLSKEDSPKIDTPEKCIELVKKTFNNFFREGGFSGKNMDLMCALHLDKPHHLHIHFEFWEKEPKTYDNTGKRVYRAKGKVNKKAIDNMFVRISDFLSGSGGSVYEKRVKAIACLKEALQFRNLNVGSDKVLSEFIELAKALPKTGRLSYGSKDMLPFKDRVDGLVEMLIASDSKIKRADKSFYKSVDKKRKQIAELTKTPHSYNDNQNILRAKYRYNIDPKNIRIVNDIVSDYKRRQGNLVLGLAKIIKPEIYEKKKNKKYKANDNRLKRGMSMSSKKIKGLFSKFVSSFWQDCNMFERDFSHRLQEIEEEMKNKNKEKEGNAK